QPRQSHSSSADPGDAPDVSGDQHLDPTQLRQILTARDDICPAGERGPHSCCDQEYPSRYENAFVFLGNHPSSGFSQGAGSLWGAGSTSARIATFFTSEGVILPSARPPPAIPSRSPAWVRISVICDWSILFSTRS